MSQKQPTGFASSVEQSATPPVRPQQQEAGTARAELGFVSVYQNGSIKDAELLALETNSEDSTSGTGTDCQTLLFVCQGK